MTADGEIHEIFCGDCQPANEGSPHRPLICEQRRSAERAREYHETDDRLQPPFCPSATSVGLTKVALDPVNDFPSELKVNGTANILGGLNHSSNRC